MASDENFEKDIEMGESFSFPYKSYQMIKMIAKSLQRSSERPFDSLIQVLFEIAEKYQLSEVEMIIWSLYLESIPYHDMNVEYCAYASKLFSCSDHETIRIGTPSYIKDSFNDWAVTSKLRIQLSFTEINKKFNFFNAIKEEVTEETPEINYNDYVDSIILS